MKRNKLLTLFAAFAMAATVSAQVTFTCTAGTNFNGGEGIPKLFDGNTGTKYCGNGGANVYALVTASEPVYVWGYDMTTANDNEQYSSRCIKKWSFFGTNDPLVAANPNASGWVTLSDYSDNNDALVQAKNYYKQRFFCEKGVTTPFKYFKVVLNDTQFIQLSEFTFLYETNKVVSYNWKESSTDNSKKAVDLLLKQKWEGGNLAADHNWFTIETADGQPHAVKKYSFTTHDDGSWKDRAPKSWKIEGSNDNSSWVTIDEVVDDATIQNANFTTYEFTPSNTTDKFRYIKLTLNAMKSTGWTQIGEFHVLSIADIPAKQEYCEDLINIAKANPFDSESLGTKDPWYVEYKAIYDDMDANMASSISAGSYDDFMAQLEKMFRINGLMTQFKNGANYVAFDGSATWGDGHWTQLFDGLDGREGRAGTKWGAHFADTNAKQFVIFRVKAAFKPFFYKLVTGGDTYTYRGRNWKTWNVYGGNFTNLADASYDPSKWTLLDKRENITEEYLPFENNYPASFDFNQGVSEPYYYYMVEVIDSYTRNDGTQMNEMALCTQEEFEATRAPLVAYFNDFDTTRPIESDFNDELAQFNTLFAQLQTTADAVQLTKLYNQCVALRAVLEANMDWVDFTTTVTEVGGVYQLSSATGLVLFSTVVNEGKGTLDAVLTANIDMASVAMAPIGTVENPYKGTFDGQGKAIKNYTYDHSDVNNVGLFGYISGATIQNVMLKGATINGNANAGGLVGNAQNASTIKNNAVVDSDIEGRDHVAAIAANATGGTVISNNYSDADVKSRQYQAGGMVGTIFSATIEKNLFTGTVTCQNNGDASGLVSRIDGVASPQPIIRNNMVAASSVSGGTTFSLIRADWSDRPVTFADNYILKSTVYSTGEKNLTEKDDKNGRQVTLSEATTPEFFAETLGWDMTNDWQYVARYVFPVLAWMDAVVPVEDIAVTSAGYATYFTKAELDFSTLEPTVSAYVPQVVDKKWVHLEPITYVPADLGIVIKAAAGTYNIPYSKITAKDVPSDLKAAPAGFTATGDQFILAENSGVVGFYKATVGTAIPEGKGYIEIAGSPVKALFFVEDDATGINSLNDVKDSNDVIYNVAGQRLNKVQKGINIVNGKKIMK